MDSVEGFRSKYRERERDTPSPSSAFTLRVCKNALKNKILYVEENAKKYADYNSHISEPPAACSSWKGGNKATYNVWPMGTPLNEGSKHFKNFPRDVLVGTTDIRANVRPK
jgi:hypothetical protein